MSRRTGGGCRNTKSSRAGSPRTFSVDSPVFCFLRGAEGLLGSLGSRGFRGFFSLGLSSAMGLPSGPTSFFLR